MYQKYFRLIIYRFQICVLLLVYKLYSFFVFVFVLNIYICFIYIYIPTTSLILRFTIYISLRHIPKYTLRKVIISHYRFLSSKAYQKRYYVIEIGPGVPGSVRWIVDLKAWVQGHGSWIPGPGSGSFILDYAGMKHMNNQTFFKRGTFFRIIVNEI